jgi:hypothetical protein
VQRFSLNQSLIALCKRGSMKETEAILDEIFRLVSEQAKAYVPILRWKHAERFALRYLHEEDRKRITPLIELTPQTFQSRKTAERVAPHATRYKWSIKRQRNCWNHVVIFPSFWTCVMSPSMSSGLVAKRTPSNISPR